MRIVPAALSEVGPNCGASGASGMVFSVGAAYVFASEVALSPAALLTVTRTCRASARPTVMVVVAVPFFSLIAGPGTVFGMPLTFTVVGPQPFELPDSK